MDYFNFFRFPGASKKVTITPPPEDEVEALDNDEPPEPRSSTIVGELVETPDLFKSIASPDATFAKAAVRPLAERRTSLLTSGLTQKDLAKLSQIKNVNGQPPVRRGLSTASVTSGYSATTAELTSDDGQHGASRTHTPSPPIPSNLSQLPGHLGLGNGDHLGPLTKASAHAGPAPEITVEATLGRKRCIMFACNTGKADAAKPEPKPLPSTEVQTAPKQDAPAPVRKSCLRWACPKTTKETSTPPANALQAPPTTCPAASTNNLQHAVARPEGPSEAKTITISPKDQREQAFIGERPNPQRKRSVDTEVMRVHELGGLSDSEDPWITAEPDCRRKMLVDGGRSKEDQICKIGRDMEREDAEAADDDEADDGEDDEEQDEDATSVGEPNDDDDDDDNSDRSDESDGNESDNEKGFGSSDVSESGSFFDLWAPGVSTAGTSIHMTNSIPIRRRTLSESSNGEQDNSPEQRFSHVSPKRKTKPKERKPIMRPGTPELPDSTDFVCGTLDEDRPMEQAYLACREQKRRARANSQLDEVDPSLPNLDFDSNDEDVEVVSKKSGKPIKKEVTPPQTFTQAGRRARSPPPAKQRMRSPPPAKRLPLKKAHASQDETTYKTTLHGLSTLRKTTHFAPQLADLPPLTRTKSLPRRPVPAFLAHHKNTADFLPRTAARKIEYVRGPNDILAGLEKKKQLRARKLEVMKQRQNASGKQEKRLIPGIGCARMKEIAMGVKGDRVPGGAEGKKMLSI